MSEKTAQIIAKHIAENCMWCFCQSWEGTVRCDDVEGLSEEIEKVLRSPVQTMIAPLNEVHRSNGNCNLGDRK